jgi:hypothetical protein
MSTYAVNMNKLYPSIDCDVIETNFGGYDSDVMLRWAFLDYTAYALSDGADPLSGALQCFCDYNTNTLGNSYSSDYWIDFNDDGTEESAEICNDWYVDT